MEDEWYSVENYCHNWWEQIFQCVKGAVVFMEDCCTECLHWEGGLFKMLDAGAITVKSLSPFEKGEPGQRKVVFISKGSELSLHSIKAILQNNSFINCIFIVTTHSDVLNSEQNGLTFPEIENRLTSWIPKKPCVVEVMYAALFAVPVTKNIFVTPVYSQLYPKFGGAHHAEQPAGVDLHSLATYEKNQVRRLAESFNEMLRDMDANAELFYVGAFSSVLAGVLEHIPSTANRRKDAKNQLSLILVDRSVDLCSVSSHASDSLLDKVMATLPRFPTHTTDVAVNMSPICDSSMVSVTEDIHLCPGCLCHPGIKDCEEILEQCIHKTQNEVMLDLYDKLSKASSTPSRLPPRVTAQHLEKLVISFKGNQDLIGNNLGLLQQSLAVVQTLKSPLIPQIDLLICLEKQVLQNLSTSRDSTSILAQISNIIKSREQRGLSIEPLLALLVHIYSLAGCDVAFSEAQEISLHEALKVALYEDRKELQYISYEDLKLVSTPEGCSNLASRIISRLKDVAKTRQLFTRYKTLIKRTDDISPAECRCVLQEFVYDLIDADKPDIPDLKSRRDGLKDFFKSGLNMLMSTASKKAVSASKHPLDNRVVMIFVIGGVTADECSKMHRAVISSGSDTHLIIGSTAMINPVDAMRQALMLNFTM